MVRHSPPPCCQGVSDGDRGVPGGTHHSRELPPHLRGWEATVTAHKSVMPGLLGHLTPEQVCPILVMFSGCWGARSHLGHVGPAFRHSGVSAQVPVLLPCPGQPPTKGAEDEQRHWVAQEAECTLQSPWCAGWLLSCAPCFTRAPLSSLARRNLQTQGRTLCAFNKILGKRLESLCP